ncbi:MAG TPA: hypothetical protein VKD22_05565 [Ramlibacter sp.]|nr:hypothetical protein [Ramlibacter sp.]
MTQIRYVGTKAKCTAFKDKTGITWAPDAVHEIADAKLAERMLRHDDVFAPAGAVSLDPLDGLDEAALRELAKARGLKVPGIGLMKGENLRAKVRAALAEAG